MTISDYAVLMLLAGALILPSPQNWTPRILAGIIGVIVSGTAFSLMTGDPTLLISLGAIVGAGLLAVASAELRIWIACRRYLSELGNHLEMFGLAERPVARRHSHQIGRGPAYQYKAIDTLQGRH